MTSYTQTIKENDDGDGYIELPEELLKQVGWVEGDILGITYRVNGVFELYKKKEND